MEGLDVSTVLIEHDNLQTLPLGSVMSDKEHIDHRDSCSGHCLRQTPDNEDLEESYCHRCSVEFACALAAWVRKETPYRCPTIVQDLLYQRNLWQHRMERLLDVTMCCSKCSAELSKAFE